MTHTVHMAAGTQISVEEYLKTVYRPDRDYVDGVVEKRNLGVGPTVKLDGTSIEVPFSETFN